MPDVTLTLSAEDQTSGVLDRIVNSLESLNDAVADQTGVYSEFQREIIRKQESANQAVQSRVDNERKVYDSIKNVLERTEKMYKDHAQSIENINRGISSQEGEHEQKMAHQQQVTADAMKIKQLENTVKRESDIRKSDFESQKDHVDANKHTRRMEHQGRVTTDKSNIKQSEDAYKRESDIRKRGFEEQKDHNEENKHARRMAYQEQVTADRAKLKELGATTSKESDLKKGAQANQEHLITAEGHARRMEYQQQVTTDDKSLRQLKSTIKEEDATVKRGVDNLKDTIDKNKHERKSAHQEQVTSDKVMLKQLDDTIKKEDAKREEGLDNRKNTIDREKHERKTAYQGQVTMDKKKLKQLDDTIKNEDARRREQYHDRVQDGKKEIERLRHQNRKELQTQREHQKKMSVGGRGRGRGLGGASQVFTGVLAADLFGVGIRDIYEWNKAILQATIKYQGMVLGLRAVEGSAEKAAVQLDRIIEIAKLPGIQLEPAIKAVVTLRALKLEGELVERTIKAIGNALATLGREGELGGVVLALSQIIGKGKIHAEEINQIAERLPLIRGILVEEFGTANTEVLQKMEIGIEDFIERITQGLERLPKVATQIGTSFKNLGNQWFLFTTQIGTYVKDIMGGAIDWVTGVLEKTNKSLKDVNQRFEDAKQQELSVLDAQRFVKEASMSRGTSPERNEAEMLISSLRNELDAGFRADRYNMAMSQFREKHDLAGDDEQPGLKDLLAILRHGNYLSDIRSEADMGGVRQGETESQIADAQKNVEGFVDDQEKFAKVLGDLNYDTLYTRLLSISNYTRTLEKELDPTFRKKRFETESKEQDIRGINDPRFKQLRDDLILTDEERTNIYEELDGLKRATRTYMDLVEPAQIREAEQAREQAKKAAEANVIKLQIYAEKIAKLVASEIVPELDPSLEQKIRRVAESKDVSIGIEAKVLGLQDQFNAAVGVGLDSLLRSVDNQLERDMSKIANNIKSIAEKLRPEIAALKTKALREAAQDEVLADIRKKYETVAELHKQIITEYYNSMVELEVTFKQWLRDTGGGAQIPAQMLSRIDKLAESQMIQDAIGLQLEGLAEPFNRVREYALETLTRTIQGDTQNQLIKLRESVLEIAKATDPDFHTYTHEKQTNIFNELFEQRAPAIRASEQVLLNITSDRFNAILDIHLEFQKWYQDTVGKDTIAPELESMVSKITSRSDFGEAVQFRVEGFETTFQHERGRMIQAMVQQLQKDTQRALQGAANQARDALVAHEDYVTMTPEQRKSEWSRIYDQLKAPIQAGMGIDVKSAIEHFDKVIEVQTVYNEWLRNTAQTPIISETDMSRLKRAIQSDEVQMGIEFEIAGMTTTFKDVKGYALQSLVDSINEDAQKQIAREAENVSAILLADPATLEMSRSEIQGEIKKIHDKRIAVINLGRDLAIENVQAEFENLSRQELMFRRLLSQRTGQTKMQREITEDVQKVVRGGDIQKAFEPESRFEIMSRDSDEIINKGLQDIFKQIDRDSQIDLEKRLESAGGSIRSRLGDMAGLLEGESGGVFMGAQLDQFISEQEAIVNAKKELRKTQAEDIYHDEIQREKEAHAERQNVKRDNDRIDVLEDNRIREQIRQAETRYQHSVEDSALSAANNVISAWQQVSQQTDTMVDDVVGAVATITLQVTEMLLTIQRTSAASSAAGVGTSALGQFAQYAGFAGIALGAAATVYSFIDSRDNSREQRNNIRRPRPTQISHR